MNEIEKLFFVFNKFYNLYNGHSSNAVYPTKNSTAGNSMSTQYIQQDKKEDKNKNE